MATDSIITLERLRCIREIDASGHSEPYIWPALLWIDNNTLTTPEQVGITSPALGNARVVIKNDMRAGETADIPASVGRLRLRFEDDLNDRRFRRLFLVVVLWEEDETPNAAMRAGFQAFSSELRAAVADNLFDLNQALEQEREELLDAIIETIETRVRNRVGSAISNGLTGFEKVRIALGTLNLDDPINSEFINFGDPGVTPSTRTFTLAFTSSSSIIPGLLTNNYEIEGNLQVRPVRVDLCQAQVDAVKAAQFLVDSIDGVIQELQAGLDGASPAEKTFINSEIKRLREEELPIAIAALEDARRALLLCRAGTPFGDTIVGVFT